VTKSLGFNCFEMLIQGSEGVSQSKVVLLGDSRVGKTSLITRKVRGGDQTDTKATVGCQCNDLTLTVSNRHVNIQVWDTAGQEMYRALVPVYLRGAHAALLVYDITDKDSFHALPEWWSLLEDTISPTTPLLVVANKIDLLDAQEVSHDLGKQFADAHKASFHMVSALTGDGVDELFQDIGEMLLKSRDDRVDTEKKGIVAYSGEEKKCGC
jgi:small GTP-binding protein